MERANEEQTLKHIPENSAVVGAEYNFWLNEEDDVYDEYYTEQPNPEEDKVYPPRLLFTLQ